MASISSIALSGINTAQSSLNSSAHNVANLSTSGFHRQEVVQIVQVGGGVSTSLIKVSAEGSALETDVVAQLLAKNSFLANLAVFNASNKMAAALLDRTA